MRDRDRRHLHPLVLPLLHQHQSAAAADDKCGVTTLIETYRAPDVQALDWAKGRNNAGQIVDPAAVVTHKRPGDSLHQTQRWAQRCPDCAHEVSEHIAAAPGEILCCAAGGPNLGESCPCTITRLRLATFEWVRVPASLAYHLALLCRGCHPTGTIVGMGAHARMTPDDLARVARLGQHAQGLGLRWGGDWDGDRRYLEKGESDLYHFEKVYGPLAQVQAVLAIRGGRLEEGLRT